MGFLKLTDIIKNSQSRYPSLAKRLDEASALGRWTLAVGSMIAKHSRALRVQDGILWVEVDHPIWKSELHHRKRQILDILNGKSSSQSPASGSMGELPPLSDIFFVDPRNSRSDISKE